MLRIWEEIIRTKTQKIELANFRIIEMVSVLKADVQRMISICAHKLVELFTNVVHILLITNK